MLETEHYQQFIADSIKDLPLDALEEIADFVTFLQQKIKKKYTLQQSDNALLLAELHLLSHHEQ